MGGVRHVTHKAQIVRGCHVVGDEFMKCSLREPKWAMNSRFCAFCAIRWRGQSRGKGRGVDDHEGLHGYLIGGRAHHLHVCLRVFKTSYKNPRNDVYMHQHPVTLCRCFSRPIFVAN